MATLCGQRRRAQRPRAHRRNAPRSCKSRAHRTARVGCYAGDVCSPVARLSLILHVVPHGRRAPPPRPPHAILTIRFTVICICAIHLLGPLPVWLFVRGCTDYEYETQFTSISYHTHSRTRHSLTRPPPGRLHSTISTADTIRKKHLARARPSARGPAATQTAPDCAHLSLMLPSPPCGRSKRA